MNFIVYTDGASRGNPGKSASGYRIFDERHKLIIRESFYNGIRTNNEAEYLAVMAALKKVGNEYGYENALELFSDSELVVRQLTGKYKVRDKGLKVLNKEALELIKRFGRCVLKSVPRENEHVAAVDKELKRLLDRMENKGRGLGNLSQQRL